MLAIESATTVAPLKLQKLHFKNCAKSFHFFCFTSSYRNIKIKDFKLEKIKQETNKNEMKTKKLVLFMF